MPAEETEIEPTEEIHPILENMEHGYGDDSVKGVRVAKALLIVAE